MSENNNNSEHSCHGAIFCGTPRAVAQRDCIACAIELDERETMLRDVRDFYGDEAAELVANGWTIDSAVDHVQGACDLMLCTHESHRDEHGFVNEAEIMARVTGAVASTYTVERRELDGSLTTERVERFTRNNDDAIVDIADVVPDAIRVDVEDVRATDEVFDIFGGTHKIKSVKLLKRSTRITREDGCSDSFPNGSQITVRRTR